MAGLQTLHLAHLPPDLAVHVALFTDLQNASFLRDQLLQGNSDFEYAFVDASVILSTTHVLAAVFRAANDWLSGRLRSRNVHSEIVLSLGMNNNISHSLQTFGISPSTTSLIVIKLTLASPSTPEITASSISTHLATHVKGTPVSFDDESLKGLADVEKIKRVYKLGGGEGKGGKGGRRRKDGSVEGSGGVGRKGGNGEGEGDERERKELEIAVLGLMALRGAV